VNALPPTLPLVRDAPLSDIKRGKALSQAPAPHRSIMKTIEYKVEFLAPAFLGNAKQSGQWRTPPFKALLRQWWRVAVAHSVGYDDYRELRRREAQLFGHAWLESDKDAKGKPVHARASSLRMRLSRWDDGREKTTTAWGNRELEKNWKIKHPEVTPPIGPLLYLGYGPLKTDREALSGKTVYPTKLKSNIAIQSGEWATLSVVVSEEYIEEIESAFFLMDAYGTLGGRSRNGWGSARFTGIDGFPRKQEFSAVPQIDWTKALKRDWPHAVGRDGEGPLVWEFAEPFPEWQQAMKELAKFKISLRTQFKFHSGEPHSAAEDRHWLSYPITKHKVKGWDNLRLPNSLRFKLRPVAGSSDKLKAVVFHMPCLPPKDFRPELPKVRAVWDRVHRFLDSSSALRRISE